MLLCYLVELDMLLHLGLLPKYPFIGASLDSEALDIEFRLTVTHAEIFHGGLNLNDEIPREGLTTVTIINKANWTERQKLPQRPPSGIS